MARCIDCTFYPDNCGYWERKPESRAGYVNEKTIHGCHDFRKVRK